MTPLGVKHFTEDDTLFRSLSNLNPDNKPVCIFQREGKILPEDEVKLMETDKKFSESYFSTH